MAPEPFYMLSLDVDAKRLIERGRARGLPLRDVDYGYLIHAHLTALFGGASPAPFAVRNLDDRGRMSVLAYSGRDKTDLRRHADLYADPTDIEACDWSKLAAKVMPTTWEPGKRLGFEVRVCPTVRRRAPDRGKTIEKDAFLAACDDAGKDVPVDREATYLAWLRAQAGRSGARIDSAQLTAFSRERVLRRRQDEGRTASVPEFPSAVLAGELTIVEPEPFGTWLRRGVGRHRAFGFGMLLLRPPA